MSFVTYSHILINIILCIEFSNTFCYTIKYNILLLVNLIGKVGWQVHLGTLILDIFTGIDFFGFPILIYFSILIYQSPPYAECLREIRCRNRIEVIMATIREISEKLGVSISTVSKGLNGASDISAKTRQMVLDTALEMGYKGKGGRGYLGKKVCIVIVQLPYSNINEYGYELVSGFRLAATEKGFLASVISLDTLKNAAPTYDEAMERLGYVGAFFVGLNRDDDYYKHFRHTKVPTVLFEEFVSNPMVSMLATNLMEGIYLAIEHLYQLGHRNIAFINGPNTYTSSEFRMLGFKQAMRDFHLDIPTRFVGSAPYYPPDKAKSYIAKYIEAGITGIVCANDYIAAAVISEATRLGKHIPEDLSVIGFDDIPLCTYLNPNLTTINENRLSLGRNAIKTLDALIHGEQMAICMNHPRLINRYSTAPAPASSDIF